MKKLVSLMLGAALTTGAVWANTDADVLKKLEQLQEQVRQQQAELADLRARVQQSAAVSKDEVSALVKTEVNSAIETSALGQVKDVAPAIQLSKQIKNLTLKGDLRLRFESQERDRHRDDADSPNFNADYNEETRDRFRTRLRLGGVWKTAEEGWEVGLGLATGGAESSSTNDTWSEEDTFETGDIRLDYAYAKHTWETEGMKHTLTLGQQVNPFISSSVFWDGDIRPAGVTWQTRFAEGLFGTIGAYDVRHVGRDETDVMMVAAQGGFDGELGENLTSRLAAAYYHLNDPVTNNNIPGFGIPAGQDSDYGFDVVQLYGDLGTKVGEVGLTFYGEIWRNLAAKGQPGQTQMAGAVDGSADIDPEDGDLGWVLGLDAKLGAFSAGYMYGEVGSDSVYREFKDSDFGDTAGMGDTDVKGHKLSLGYNVTKNLNVGLTAMMLSEDQGFERDGTLYQLDAVYKF